MFFRSYSFVFHKIVLSFRLLVDASFSSVPRCEQSFRQHADTQCHRPLVRIKPTTPQRNQTAPVCQIINVAFSGVIHVMFLD